VNKYRHPYNHVYFPSFPALPVVLRNNEDGRRTEVVEALLDTGSDGTLIPLRYLHEIMPPIIQEARLRSHWGERRTISMFLVDIVVADLTLPGLLVVGDDDGDEIILGRNVLNKLRLELDGPADHTIVPRQ
jgi:predicted aspartyl protease